MNRVLSMTRRTASSISVFRSTYCAFRSSSGTLIVALVVMLMVDPSPRGLRVHPALVLEQLLHRYVAPDARGRAEDDLLRRHVGGHDRSGRDERVLADHDARQGHRAGADACALLHGDALEVLE